MILRWSGSITRAKAKAAARRRDWHAALAAYRKLEAGGRATARDRVQLGHVLKEMNELDAAESVYRAAAADYPADIDVQRQLGLFLRRIGRSGEAIEVLARIMAVSPDATDLSTELASLGIDEDAIDERLLTGSLRGAGSTAGGVSHERIEALLRAGDAERALWLCRRALFCDPRSADLLVLLARALDGLGRREGALQALLAAWRLRPGDPETAAALHAWGWAPADLEALVVSTWAPTDPDVLRHGGPRLPQGLDARARTILVHLASAMRGEG